MWIASQVKGVAYGEVLGTIVLLYALVLIYSYFRNLYNSKGNDAKARLKRTIAGHWLYCNLLALGAVNRSPLALP